MARYPSRLLSPERGAVSVSSLLLLGAVAAFLYAILGAGSGDIDRYGRVPVPSSAVLELPGEEVEISYIELATAGQPAAAPPADLKIVVRNADTGAPVTVNSRTDQVTEEAGEVITPVARVDAPGGGSYEVTVTSAQLIGRTAPQIAIGQGPVGAVGERFSRVGELITGPAGIVAGVLLLAAMLAPRVERALKSTRR